MDSVDQVAGPYAAEWRRYRRWCALSLIAMVTMVFIVMPAVAWRKGGVAAGGVALFFGFFLVMAIPLNMVKLFRCPRCHAFFDFWRSPVLASKCSSCGLPKGAVADPNPTPPIALVNATPPRRNDLPRPHGSPGAR